MAQLAGKGAWGTSAGLLIGWVLLGVLPAHGGDLTAEANQIARQQVQQLGQGYSAHIDAVLHIVYVSALDDKHLQETIGLLSAFADAYRRTLPAARPAWNITVVLPSVDDYKKLKRPFEACVGFYSPAEHRLVSIDRGRTLLHEFTHALHHADIAAAKQVHPIWVSEGLATLFEASEITPSGLKPRLDLRLPVVQRALKAEKAIPLRRLLTMGRKPFLKDAELAYAQARYVMHFLYAGGHLANWYKRYKATFTHDPDGVKALEATLASRLFLIEPDWQKWVLSLQMPSSEPRLQQGRLGLEVQNHPQGVKVVGLVPGSAAQLAGRIRVGDVVEKLNGHNVTNPIELVGAIRAAGALQTIKVQLLRHGRRMTVIQPLGAPSAR
jgi:hypothetical protein